MDKINFKPFPVLMTDRLVLRKLKMSDDELIFDYQSNKENFKFVDMQIYKDIRDAQKYIDKMNFGVENNKWIIWAIADKNTNTILGTISIWNISKKDYKAELGYGLFSDNRGKGIMTEALNKVVEYGFNNMGLKIIQAYTNAENDKSINLLKQNGFTKTDSFIETETSTKEPMNMLIYEVKCDS